MSVTEALGLAGAAAAAGGINAVAGGGTLVTFPALIAVGTPKIIANATSTMALVIGTSGSVFGFRKHLAAVKRMLWLFTPPSIIGGCIGAWLLTATSERTFSRLVPFLILFATIIFLFQGALKHLQLIDLGSDAHGAGRGRLVLALVFQLLVAIYGGYFGAGIGILMLATLGFLGLRNIHEMNTVKTTIGSLINVIASIWFIYKGLIDWPKTGVMTVGAVTGYFLGAHYSQRISQRAVRVVIAIVGFVISAWTFYEQFIARHK
jgi:uncharacterized membrane protein YfcA